MRVAAVNWGIEPGNPKTFLDHLERIVSVAHSAGAQLCVLPECIDLECLGESPDLPIARMAEVVSTTANDRRERMRELSQTFGMTIVGGSMIVQDGNEFRNRAYVFESGVESFQDKIVMTQFELEEWGLSAGAGLARFGEPRLGVTVCYDCEFPGSGRLLAERGVLVQAVPAFTETRYGFQRVRWSCHARAIENQVFVVHASLVGSLGREPVPTTYGSSAIITPSVEGFPLEAVLGESGYGEEGIAVADLDFDRLLQCRNSGDVRNWHDRDKGRWI